MCRIYFSQSQNTEIIFVPVDWLATIDSVTS